MKPILEIQNISKTFQIHHEKQAYLSIRDSLTSIFKKSNSSDEVFYALKEVSFDVFPGDSIGIIGRNGAGKSTLLKILSKITPPTAGKIISRGRIASLLEVGTGFHPELTGRENVFLNGSILGMKRAEIQKNFDAIVDFSGVEKFLDTPLKHYSSGMQLRLAFAVAAFLENEILIIDEVLAVGDSEFQKKCMGKMEDVSKSGRTILFVSHNIESISVLCSKGILLDSGKIQTKGNIDEVVLKYTNHYQDSFKEWLPLERPGDEIAKLNKIFLVNNDLSQIFQPERGQEFGVCIEFEVFENDVKPVPNLHFYNTAGVCCFVTIADSKELFKGVYQAITWIPSYFLNNNIYLVGVALTTLKTEQIHLYAKDIINIEIIENKLFRNHEFGGQIPGVIRPQLKNQIIKIN